MCDAVGASFVNFLCNQTSKREASIAFGVEQVYYGGYFGENVVIVAVGADDDVVVGSKVGVFEGFKSAE